MAVALAHDDNGLALAGLIGELATILPVLREIGRTHVSAEIRASTSATLPEPPSFRPLNSSAIASRSLCSMTQHALCDMPRSRDSTSAFLPFTSLMNTAIAVKGSGSCKWGRVRRETGKE